MQTVIYLKTNKQYFANRLGVEISTIYRWLKGECSPTFDDLCAIIRVTQDDANELMDFFYDLKSSQATKTKGLAREYVNGIKTKRLWKEVFDECI